MSANLYAVAVVAFGAANGGFNRLKYAPKALLLLYNVLAPTLQENSTFVISYFEGELPYSNYKKLSSSS